MAPTLIWSKEALDDIAGIAEYINRDSPFYADQVAHRLFENWQRRTDPYQARAYRA